MKRTFILLFAVLFTTAVYSQNFKISQGVSFIPTDHKRVTQSEYNVVSAGAKNILVDYTALSIKAFDCLSFDTTAQLNKTYQSINCNLIYKKSITDTFGAFINTDFDFVKYTSFRNIYSDMCAGIYSDNKIGMFDIGISGYAGYVFVNKVSATSFNKTAEVNKSNMSVIGFEVSAAFEWNNFSAKVYGSLVSYQNYYFDLCMFWPSELDNKIGAELEYHFSDNWSVFGIAEHYCIHPEKPWDNKANFKPCYDEAKTTFTVGVHFAF